VCRHHGSSPESQKACYKRTSKPITDHRSQKEKKLKEREESSREILLRAKQPVTSECHNRAQITDQRTSRENKDKKRERKREEEREKSDRESERERERMEGEKRETQRERTGEKKEREKERETGIQGWVSGLWVIDGFHTAL